MQQDYIAVLVLRLFMIIWEMNAKFDISSLESEITVKMTPP